MLKSFDELREVNVLPFCEKRDGLDYLNWAKCIDLLHKYGAKKSIFYTDSKPQNWRQPILYRHSFCRQK